MVRWCSWCNWTARQHNIILIHDSLEPTKVSRPAQAALDGEHGLVALSDISLREIAMLIAKGRIDPGMDAIKRGEAGNRKAETGKPARATARAVQQPSNGAARVCGRCSQQAP